MPTELKQEESIMEWIVYILNPSREAKTISPGNKPKNFFPIFEFAMEPVKNPVTFTAPERTPDATFSVIFVTLFTLRRTSQWQQIISHLHSMLKLLTGYCN